MTNTKWTAEGLFPMLHLHDFGSSISHGKRTGEEARGRGVHVELTHLVHTDRKSTRLNSSHWY